MMATIVQTDFPVTIPTVEQQVQRRLTTCHYFFVFRNVEYKFKDGVLTLRGCVPSFYLKQTLQELLRGIGPVEQINNEVNVVNASGLSSVHPKTPR